VITDSLFTWAVGASVGAHAIGLAVSSAFGLWTPAVPAPPPIPIEIVMPAAPEATPPPPPKPPRVQPPKPVRTAVAPLKAAPIQPSTLIDEKAALDTPAPAINVPQHGLPANALTSQTTATVPGLREGGSAGAGELFSTGDLAVRPGSGSAAGSGASGRAGTGFASIGMADAVAAAGVTSFAKPLGGYQTIPRYPESARRAGIEGVTVLRFVVMANGHVEKVQVERSAGNLDLDQSAIDAVKTWLFEPARRGKEAVPVWVTLPVRFALTSR
jgi:protein TonB